MYKIKQSLLQRKESTIILQNNFVKCTNIAQYTPRKISRIQDYRKNIYCHQNNLIIRNSYKIWAKNMSYLAKSQNRFDPCNKNPN